MKLSACFGLLALLALSQGQESIESLIADLAVKSGGNSICNTAAMKLVSLGDQAVPHLAQALDNPSDSVRHYAIRCLGDINTDLSRKELLAGFESPRADVKRNASYALTWHPHRDAIPVYISMLSKGSTLPEPAMKALGELRCSEALPAIQPWENDTQWRVSYLAFVTQRKIIGEVAPEIITAIETLRYAKFHEDVDRQKLSRAVSILRKEGKSVYPDLVDILFHQEKANETKIEPNAKTLITEIGEPIFPVLRKATQEKNSGESVMIRALVKSNGWEQKFGPIN